ncbi:DUF4401 domain-containing protein [Myroides fluvii]|uniref:DUF4401 domain-containing protein n=1 Tax=Myroides fluvii TaxID=2572594 RepID=UPI00131B80E8|nr:DUF4401 domain-containing protein [Myroides fluvii]
MKNKALDSLMSQLENRGITIQEQVLERIQDEQSIKYSFLKVVAILGSLLAVGFFFGFLYMAIGDSLGTVSFSLFAVILYGISLLGNKKSEPALRDGVFVATYISSLACLIFAFIDSNASETTNLLIVTVFSIIGFLSFKSKLIQFLSVVGFYYGLIYLLKLIPLSYGDSFVFWLALIGLYLMFYFELNLRTCSVFLAAKFNALRNGLFVVVFLDLIQQNFERINPMRWMLGRSYGEFNIVYHRIYLVFVAIILIGLTYSTVKAIQDKVKINKMPVVTVLSCLLIVGLSFLMRGFGIPFAISVLLLVWSFHFRFQKGMALALATLALSLISYYYYLDVTLLSKSLILMGLGVLFLSLFVIYTKLNREK